MKTRAPRRKLNAKKLYFRALSTFLVRNCELLPQLQLQYGKCERWLSREFALAMNTHLAGSSAAANLPTYTDCEYRYADISVWRPPIEEPLALYEVKALYREDPIEGVVEKARRQLARSPLVIAENRVGLFFAIFVAKGAKGGWPAAKATAFKNRVRDSVREEFSSDHGIRMTDMVAPAEIRFGAESWWTASWLTWGRPK
jgi:hypothetical protein